MNASELLTAHLKELRSAARAGSVLDLACGSGRNGLYLLRQGLPVVFADRNLAALEQIGQSLKTEEFEAIRPRAKLWQVDFEQPDNNALRGKTFAAVIVFRYLYRNLFEAIRSSIVSGGLIIYETFTVDQARLGRPSNPDFLLRPGELNERFCDWHILHSFEGIVEVGVDRTPQAIAQLVAVKP